MEPEIAALATSAGTTVVTLMATDAWHRTRDGIVSLWRRVHPERAESIAAELDATREDVIAARSAGDENVEPELQREWQGRVRRLLAARPEIALELRALLDELGPQPVTDSAITQHAIASGQARIYQAGRDQHIAER
ncbi:hypothetical protein NGB36_23475 [Streptomyces sp. RB6PN25]|uniref:Uncharacterized protein n=1 Tax=Streptomyces humicola TaxID=2953240 RepID=A0ABT1Q0M1_9ACTN|nr:hypothetical protein [Streptomyces humicola]MCQ4083476.1 hypothetical protein [Streptomyces humicola]